MEVKLVVLEGKQAGQVVPVAAPKFFIGRSEECQLRPNSDLISRHHCGIFTEEGVVTVRDFNSKNGTFLNGVQVHGEQELRSGDKLTVGPLEFEVHIEVALAGQKKSPVKSVEEAAARTVATAGARPATGDDDMDISDWLGGQDDGGETQTMDASQAGTVAVNTAGTVSEFKPEAAEPEEHADEKEKKDAKRKVTGPQGLKRPKAADSQSAAADTLRHFLRRR
ncbi:MAG: FHA domain-containing protein [Pirellulales bacterium]|nr:FHA domain-containing protein [Pirellulales bacterium]